MNCPRCQAPAEADLLLKFGGLCPRCLLKFTEEQERPEFPDFDATLRGTISIGRRLQDPLSELVKIDPQHVGVGLYQHDVNPKQLRESLDGVIESCVNAVGVDLNTASVPLLRHVSGLNQLVARDLVEFRKANGPFRSREQLMQQVWGPNHFGTVRTVDNFVARLRSKIERDPDEPKLIETVRGVGYRFNP